ncbi:MAG: hypothetical protein GC164_15460 [Phycisphaera sp.]|nr:hypothetical protein [Phycisphaera sp.]
MSDSLPQRPSADSFLWLLNGEIPVRGAEMLLLDGSWGPVSSNVLRSMFFDGDADIELVDRATFEAAVSKRIDEGKNYYS